MLKIARAGALNELDTDGAQFRAAESYSLGLPASAILRTTVSNIWSSKYDLGHRPLKMRLMVYCCHSWRTLE